jgi:hypothetical protein
MVNTSQLVALLGDSNNYGQWCSQKNTLVCLGNLGKLVVRDMNLG